MATWDVSAVTDMSDMFAGVTLRRTNYDALLNGWALRPSLVLGLTFSAGSSLYSTSAAAARQTVIDTYWWTTTDGGPE